MAISRRLPITLCTMGGWLVILCSLSLNTVLAANLLIYDEVLANGWANWSWDTAIGTSPAPVHNGAGALKVTYNTAWAALSLRTNPPVATAEYIAIRFWVHGGAGNTALTLYTQGTDTGETSTKYDFTASAGAWQEIRVPLSALGNPTHIARLTIQNRSGVVQPTYYLDALRLRAPATSLRLTVDVAARRQRISPYIYGMNSYGMQGAVAAFMNELELPVRRWGGNLTTRYNWQNDIANHASDYFFINSKQSSAINLPADSAVNRFIKQNRSAGTQTFLTVPMIGYVAKNDATACGFSIAAYGPQTRHDPQRPDCGNGLRVGGDFVIGNAPADTSVVIGPAFVTNWVNALTQRFGAANAGGIRFYNLDNEPDIWFQTHRDVFPSALTYAQFRSRTIRYAAAIKAADPTAKTLGPAVHGWTYYWHSPYDGQREDWTTPDDRNAHGGTPFVPWYLQQMHAHEQANGTRLLDYLDLHYYPAAINTQGTADPGDDEGVALSPAGHAATQALRLRSTRSLWDPTYVDESWIAEAGPAGGIVRLIPRMREWVKAHYPGTLLAIGEYNWGALDHINGALAQADVLGIFGREGVHLATLWEPPHPDQPGAFAFRMYRNYDGAEGKFGPVSVRATSTNQEQLAIYAAHDSTAAPLTMIVINKTGAAITAPLTLRNFTPTGLAQVYRYSPANLQAIVHLAALPISNTGLTATFPARSITLLRVPGTRS